MTKRFITLESGIDYGVKDTMTGDCVFDVDITELLNEQYETIQVLERYLDNMRCGALTDDRRIKELYDENEELKKENKKFKIKLNDLGVEYYE